MESEEEEEEIEHHARATHWLEVIEKIRYWTGFTLFAVPWSLLGVICVAFNVFLNVQYNHEWAKGNIFLVALTIQGSIQYVLSLLLVFEKTSYLTECRGIRLMSLISAVIWDVFFIDGCWKFWIMILDYINRQGGDLFSGDAIDVLYQLFLCYNLFLHFGFFPINSIIVFKELAFWVLNDWGLEVPSLTGVQLSYRDFFLVPSEFMKIENIDWQGHWSKL